MELHFFRYANDMKQSLRTTLANLPRLLVAFLIAAPSLFSAPAPGPSTGTNSSPAALALPAAATEPAPAKLTPDQALERLLQGNQRYVAGKATHPDQTAERRLGLASGQAPFAIILTCADSRVAPELFFDQGLGDLFVIRNAGNILDDHVIGSMEYAVEHLHAGLIVVVGHGQCGAVSAAVAGGEVPGHIRSVTEAIAPALEDDKTCLGTKWITPFGPMPSAWPAF